MFTGIANVLKRIVAEDAKNPEDPETQALAIALAPHVDRKLVKQTVMTSVYGVTHIGARQQIQNRLKERDSPVYTSPGRSRGIKLTCSPPASSRPNAA